MTKAPKRICNCGTLLTSDEYHYHGGTYGYYTCANCGQLWEVDLNGPMWPIDKKEFPSDAQEKRKYKMLVYSPEGDLLLQTIFPVGYGVQQDFIPIPALVGRISVEAISE